MGGKPMSNFVVGVTGGIGSGKTTVTNRFASHGIDIIDADVIAREVVGPGSSALQQISDRFGDTIVGADGSLDRAALRQRIFADEGEKTWLNNLLHPLIRTQIEAALQAAASPYCILVAPLLLENKLTYLTDRVLVVDVSEETQIERTMARDANERAQVEAIMAAQMDRTTRLAAADDLVDNELSYAEVYDAVDRLHQQYLTLASR
jgi:dephospho-CoA kinase